MPGRRSTSSISRTGRLARSVKSARGKAVHTRKAALAVRASQQQGIRSNLGNGADGSIPLRIWDDDWSVEDWMSKMRSDVSSRSRYATLVPSSSSSSSYSSSSFRADAGKRDSVEEGHRHMHPSLKRSSGKEDESLTSTTGRRQTNHASGRAETAEESVRLIKTKRMMFGLLHDNGLAEQGAHVGNDLRLLKQLFDASRVSRRLLRDEFVEVWSGVFADGGKQTRDSIRLLFDKIDTNSRGEISLDDYLTYLMREMGADSERKAAEDTWVLGSSDESSSLNRSSILTNAVSGNSRKTSWQCVKYLPALAARSAKFMFCDDLGSISLLRASRKTIIATLDINEAQNAIRKRRASPVTSARPAQSSSTRRGSTKSNGQLLIPANVGRIINECTYGSIKSEWVIRGLRANNREAQNRISNERRPPVKAQNLSYDYSSRIHVAYNQRLDQLVVAKSDKTVNFFNYRLNRLMHSQQYKCDYPVSTLEVHANAGSYAAPPVLLIGDSSGYVNIYGVTESGVATSPTRILAHKSGETVLRLRPCASLGLLSSGMDGALVLSDAEYGTIKRRFVPHTRDELLHGVFDFDYDSRKRIIVSANYGGKIAFWDPYYNAKPVEQVSIGSPVVGIHANPEKNHVMVVLRGKVLVYDVRKLGLIQEQHDVNQEDDYFSCSCFNEDDQYLLTCSGRRVRTWDVINAPLNRAVSYLEHHRQDVASSFVRSSPAQGSDTQLDTVYPDDASSVRMRDAALCCLYSKLFEQVISVSRGGNVQVFDIFTGLPVFDFSTQHTSPVTAASLDQSGKRLLTASHDGEVLIFNFNNGGLLTSLKTETQTEIITIMHLPHVAKSIVAGTYINSVLCWFDSSAHRRKQDKFASRLMSSHDSTTNELIRNCSVTTLAYSREELSSNELLVAGDMQGHVFIYNASVGQLWRTTSVPPLKAIVYGFLDGASRISMRPAGRTNLAVQGGDTDNCITAMVFLEGLLVVGTRSGRIVFMNPIGGEWTNSLLCGADVNGEFSIQGEITSLVAVYKETLTGKPVTKSLPGSEVLLLVNCVLNNSSVLHVLSVTKALKPGHMIAKVYRTWEPHTKHTLVVDAVLVHAAHKDAQFFVTCSTTGLICLWDLEGRYMDAFRNGISPAPAWPVQRSGNLEILKLSTFTGIASPPDRKNPSHKKTYAREEVLVPAQQRPATAPSLPVSSTSRPRMNMHFKYTKAMVEQIEMHRDTQRRHGELHLFHALSAIETNLS